MSQHYVFHESASIPGVPGGPFSHCQVDIADDGTQTVTPLALLPDTGISEVALNEPSASAEHPEESIVPTDTAPARKKG